MSTDESTVLQCGWGHFGEYDITSLNFEVIVANCVSAAMARPLRAYLPTVPRVCYGG